jgi:hypothetical protein
MKPRETAGTSRRREGRARARLSAAARRRRARLDVKVRSAPLEAARRVAENFAYADTVAVLRGVPTRIVQLRTFDGPLPGIYPARRGRPRASAPRR